MQRAVKSMSLRFTPKQHAALVEKRKDTSARSWEEYFLRLAGIDLTE
ncbi:MAG: hypothetical protein WC262_13460 [Bacteroidales bacterium]|jgi:hypothetical protein